MTDFILIAHAIAAAITSYALVALAFFAMALVLKNIERTSYSGLCKALLWALCAICFGSAVVGIVCGLSMHLIMGASLAGMTKTLSIVVPMFFFETAIIRSIKAVMDGNLLTQTTPNF